MTRLDDVPVQHLTSSAEAERSRMELQRLDEQIAEMQSRRKVVALRLDQIHIATTLCKKLPDEVMVRIFSFVVASPIHLPTKTLPSFLYVCSAWMKLALRHPHLWNDIVIEEKGRRKPQCQHLVALWFSVFKPKRTTLSITTRLRGVLPLSIQPCYTQLYELKLDVSERAAKEFVSLALGDLPRLENLNLHVMLKPRKGTSFWNGPFPLLKHLPRLQKANITSDRTTTTLRLSDLGLPWVTLVELSISGVSSNMADTLVVLENCVMLRTCRLAFHTPIIPVERPEPVVFPMLNKLRVDFTDSTTYHSLLDSIVTPQIRSFHMDIKGDFVWAHGAFMGYMERNKTARIEEFGITALSQLSTRVTIDVENVLTSLPELSSLHLPFINPDIGEPTSQRWLDGISRGHMGRRLDHLCIHTKKPIEPILDMVKVRMRASKPEVKQFSDVGIYGLPANDSPEAKRQVARIQEMYGHILQLYHQPWDVV